MENKYQRFTELNVWMEFRKLVTDIYLSTQVFPKEEQMGLINQIRRCAIFVPSNIAEGCGRNHKKDSLQFFFIARGSLYELETQVYLSNDLHYIYDDKLKELLSRIEVVRKLLNGFIRYYSTSN